MNVNLETICNYKYGDILFNSVLNRHFIDTEKIKNILVDKGYFKRAAMFRCPKCRSTLFHSAMKDAKQYASEKELTCYNCDTLVDVKNLEVEPILVRTNKPFTKPKETTESITYTNTQNFEWVYDYGRICDKLNKMQKQIFEEKVKETGRKILIKAILPNGETVTLDKPIEFTSLEITDNI